ncbi:MAG: hypothetical protein GF392_03265 [Candidatus Omnitrophica bacterium]|nr:hypothetical protein [Candidatus Omnitrophota bacterium]
MDERRRSKRYPVPYPAEKSAGGKDHVLTVMDVSKTGAALTDVTDAKENEQFDLKLFLKKRRFDLKALVVHARKVKDDLYKVGVRFLDAPEDFVETLEQELEEITRHHRETHLYDHKDISFRRASEQFLKNGAWDPEEE